MTEFSYTQPDKTMKGSNNMTQFQFGAQQLQDISQNNVSPLKSQLIKEDAMAQSKTEINKKETKILVTMDSETSLMHLKSLEFQKLAQNNLSQE